MAEIRINGLANTAQTASNDDYVVLDGATNGTRKMLAKKLTEGVEQQLATTNQNVTQNTEDITDLKADIRQKTGLSEEAKVALLDCFEHVAWIDEHGQDYYDALQTALYGSTEDWTWKYESSSGQLLSQNANVSNAEFSSGVTESIVNGKLRIVQSATGTGQLSRYRLLPTTNTKARLAARVRFVTIPLANSNSGTGFRLQLSNASSNGSGVQIFERKDVNDNKYYWVVFEGQTARTLAELDTGIWYTIEVERTETKQKIYIDNQLIFESTTMSENYANNNQILLQSGGPGSDPPQTENFTVDIEWVAYKNLDIES